MKTEQEERIVFFTDEKTKADLKIKLYREGVTQTKFFNAVLEAYVRGDEMFMEWYTEERRALIKSKARRTRLYKEENMAENIAAAYALGEEEVENIFDLIAQEQE